MSDLISYTVTIVVDVTAFNPAHAARLALDDLRDTSLGPWNMSVEDGDSVVDVSTNIDPALGVATCDNCGAVWPVDELDESENLSERMDEDGPEPAGDCPDCGAFCYEEESAGDA